jgi:hypothetical protein
MLSAAKHLCADRVRPFAELTLSSANVLRLTLCDCSNRQGLCFTIESCLLFVIFVTFVIFDITDSLSPIGLAITKVRLKSSKKVPGVRTDI